MGTKGRNFFEEHIEKVVLAVVGVVSVWLLITHVLISPNRVLYGGKKLAPGEIDISIKRQADILEDKLNRKPDPGTIYEPNIGKYSDLLKSAIRDIDVRNIDFYWPLPICSSTSFSKDNRKYHIPRVCNIGRVSVDHIRAVAYVPTKKINKKNPYSKDNSEPNDIDFVTVESSIDAAQLVKDFHESFAGESVPEEWRDPCLAKPVFAAVQLQRKELLGEDDWSQWQTVPLTKIDPYKKMFKVIENAENLPPGGIKVRLLNFDNEQVMKDLLQPEAYRIASVEEEWFPPTLHEKYVKYQRDQEEKEKREAMKAERKKRQEEREKRRQERLGIRGGTMPASGRISSLEEESSVGGMAPGRRGIRGIGMRRDRGLGPMRGRRFPATGRVPSTTRKIHSGFTTKKKAAEKTNKTLKTTTINDFYDKYEKMLITEETNIAKMSKPLMFWAHDDSVEPGKSYRYRIRLGVFNPIAGTGEVAEQDISQKDKVVLWSKFSNETETVKIPARLYFFPNKIQEAKIVTVEVCRYVLGYWYSELFRVRQGEVIGKVKTVKLKSGTAKEGEQNTETTEAKIPKAIDYSTGAMYVDAMLMNNWAGGRSMSSAPYYDMLYSFDGTQIKHIPVDQRYWCQELQTKFGEIKQLEKRPRRPLRGWGSKAAHVRRVTTKVTSKKSATSENKKEQRGDRGASEMEAFRRMMERRMGGGG